MFYKRLTAHAAAGESGKRTKVLELQGGGGVSQFGDECSVGPCRAGLAVRLSPTSAVCTTPQSRNLQACRPLKSGPRA